MYTRPVWSGRVTVLGEQGFNRENCSAFIEVTLGPQKDKLVITQSNLHHNHADSDTTEAPPEKKYKPSPVVGLPAQVANNISKKFLEPSDLKRLLRFRSGAFEDRTQVLAELQSLFFTDPEARVKLVFVEDKLHTCSIKVYERYLNDLKVICPAEVFQYYFETWHPRRKTWVKKDNRTEESERNLSELVPANHVKLKQAVGYMPTLHQCLCSILGTRVNASGNDMHIQGADISSFCDYEKPTVPLLNQQVHEPSERNE
ncbi:unnamed protein product [Ranitomeya imitator]|uniref:Uncharacterized protein n=1 Tax=Ranitomeya imitator TaxID=111125 RepID=A0ABN9MJJ4_9NEOB|nr:unnamed protein product [Ranitomeya imitator]